MNNESGDSHCHVAIAGVNVALPSYLLCEGSELSGLYYYQLRSGLNIRRERSL